MRAQKVGGAMRNSRLVFENAHFACRVHVAVLIIANSMVRHRLQSLRHRIPCLRVLLYCKLAAVYRHSAVLFC